MADPAVQALAGPKQIENAAIAFVIAQEAHEGREAKDTRRDPEALTDVVSDDRLIEVKAAGTSSRGYDLWLEPNQYQSAKDNRTASGCTSSRTCGKGIPRNSGCSGSAVRGWPSC
jgi:hypothetical protein